ncbi:MAG: hypothetical protein ACI8WB_000566 [Phenylobacterium sp.]|jgi:hypothetical protein
MDKPEFNKYGTLTEDHTCKNIDELKKTWGFNNHRKILINNAMPGFRMLKAAGVPYVFIGGSFVSKKPKPGDLDGVFVTGENFDETKLPDDFLVMLEDFGLDFYADTTPTEFDGKPHIDFFRIGRNNENPGLIQLFL